MALTPQNNETFAREVDEELRRDQMTAFGRRYGLLVAAALVAILLALAGYLFWQHRREQRAERDGEQLQLAYDKLGSEQTKAVAQPLAELAQSPSDGYRAAAMFTQADVLLRDDDLRGAAAKLAAIAGDASLAKPFRDLALIRQTSAEYDQLKPEVVVTRLRGLAVPGNAFLGSAGELVATAYLQQGKRDLAGQMFARIARDKNQPASLRQRAVQMAGLLGIDAVTSTQEKSDS